MKITHDCRPLDNQRDLNVPPRTESVTYGWQCPDCKRRWKVTLWLEQDGQVQRATAEPIGRWRIFWGLR